MQLNSKLVIKRLVSILISLVMVFTLIPSTINADDNEKIYHIKGYIKNITTQEVVLNPKFSRDITEYEIFLTENENSIKFHIRNYHGSTTATVNEKDLSLNHDGSGNYNSDYFKFSEANAVFKFTSKVDGKDPITYTVTVRNSSKNGKVTLSDIIPTALVAGKEENFSFYQKFEPDRRLHRINIPDNSNKVIFDLYKSDGSQSIRAFTKDRPVKTSRVGKGLYRAEVETLPDDLFDLYIVASDANGVDTGTYKLTIYMYPRYKLKIIGEIKPREELVFLNSSAKVSADTTRDGKVFEKWIFDDNIYIDNPLSPKTFVTIQNKDVTVKAVFRDSDDLIKRTNTAVEKAEKTILQSDIDIAKKAVDYLEDGFKKAEFNDRLTKILSSTDLDALQAAREAVEKAEVSKSDTDINKAQTLVMALTPSLFKDELIQRLFAIKKDDKNEHIERFGGSNREETAILVSRFVYKTSDNVVLSGNGGDVDALTGTLLAAHLDAPLLITKKHSLNDTTRLEIQRLKAKKVYILGGVNAVSDKVEQQLKTLGLQVERISGSNRFETAAKIADKVKAPDLGMPTHAFVVLGVEARPGDALADALAIGPVSAMYNIPVLLVRQNEIPKETMDIIEKINVQEITIVGGENAVSAKVMSKLKESASYITRISGSNREETALEIAKTYFKDSDIALFAYGRKSADALVGGYLGNKLKAPILLTNNSGLTDNTKSYIKTNTKDAKVLGGEAVISKKTYDNIKSLLKK